MFRSGLSTNFTIELSFLAVATMINFENRKEINFENLQKLIESFKSDVYKVLILLKSFQRRERDSNPR